MKQDRFENVRVRFAPSPTGHLHIGGVRTALFNWLFARHHQGRFILRIEDTDQARSSEESLEGILGGLQWLGLDWDEGPHRQTHQLSIYREKAEELLKKGMAYHCYCSPEELETRRAEALKKGQTPKYDGRCRKREGAPPNRPPVIRLAAAQNGQTVINDLVRGTVTFDNSQLDDLILLRSDQTPTYNLVVVIDDAKMEISHVIRGDDHLNNTPRQVQLYKAFGYDIPFFAHLPLILGSDRTRLSKRHGATSTLAYREMGYLPQALLNYLARLGWSSGDQEIFSIEELIEKFDLNHVGKSAAVFNPDKLLWLNSHYIRATEPLTLINWTKPFLSKEGISLEPESISHQGQMIKIVTALRERSRTLIEMAKGSACYLTEDYPIDPSASKKFLKSSIRPVFEDFISKLEKLTTFSLSDIEAAFQAVIEERNIKLSHLAQPVRVALTGRTVSPGIYDVIDILGKDRTISRLKNAFKRFDQSV